MKRKIIWTVCLLTLLANAIAWQHAYKFTHFSEAVGPRTSDPEQLSAVEKASLLFTGISNPRPQNTSMPAGEYKTIKIISAQGDLECWDMPVHEPKGTVILFHGYAGEKSSLLERAYEFQKMGFNTFLVDFTGSGGSDGNSTSIGYAESGQVQDVFNYVQEREKNIVLFGTSMGAAAILKILQEQKPDIRAAILECPFGYLYKTVQARFNMMHVPAFPMAALLCFWGGVQNGYWAFSHNPATYAKDVACPVLLLYGERDERVSREETDDIYANLKGKKVLKSYAAAGHNVFIKENRDAWINDVSAFLTGEH